MAIDEYLPSPIQTKEDLPGAASVAPSPAAPAPQQQAAQQQQPVPPPAAAQPAPEPTMDEILQAQGFKPMAEMDTREFARAQIAFSSRQFQQDVKTGTGASLARGAFNTASMVSGLFGKEEWVYAADKLAAKFPPEVASYQDIKSWGDLGTFAVEAALENFANALIVAGSGFVLASAGAPIAAAAVPGSALLAASETAQTIDESGADRTAANMIPATVMNTALETLSFAKVLKNAGLTKFFGEAVESASKSTGFDSLLKEALGRTTSSFVTEATTETAQQYINQVNAELANNVELKEAIKLLPEEQAELINSALKGGFGASITTATSQAAIKGYESAVKYKNLKSNKAPLQNGEKAPEDPNTEEPIAAKVQEVLPEAPPIEEAPIKVQDEAIADTPEEQAPELSPKETLGKLAAAITKNLNIIGTETIINSGAKAFREATGKTLLTPKKIDDSTYEMDSDGTVVANVLSPEQATTPVSFIENGEVLSGTLTVAQVQANKNRTYIEGDGSTLFGNQIKNPEIIKEIVETVERWRSKYMPNRSIVLSVPDKKRNSKAGGTHGSYLDWETYDKAALAGVAQSPISRIAIRPSVLKESLYTALGKDRVNNSEVMRSVMAVLSHEVGHGVIAENISNATPEELAGIKNEHREFLTRLPNMTYGEVAQELGGPAGVSIIAVPETVMNMPFKQVSEKYLTTEQLQYLLSFEEYAAEQFSSFVSSKKQVKNDSLFWQKTIAQLRELFKDFSKLFTTAPKFEAWLENIGYRNQINEILMSIPHVDSGISSHLDVFKTLAGKFKKPKFKVEENNASEIAASIGGDNITDAIVEAMKHTKHVNTGFSNLGF